MGVIPIAQRDEHLFTDPDAFDPRRFDDPMASQHLIWPRGRHDGVVSNTDRTCPGKDVAVLLMKLICVWLIRRFEWTLIERPTWDKRSFGLNVAAPQGAMRVDAFRSIE